MGQNDLFWPMVPGDAAHHGGNFRQLTTSCLQLSFCCDLERLGYLSTCLPVSGAIWESIMGCPGGAVLSEEVLPWEQALKVHNLTPLPLCSYDTRG